MQAGLSLEERPPPPDFSSSSLSIPEASPPPAPSTAAMRELASPSSVLQSRSRWSLAASTYGDGKEEKGVETLSGLDALSKAAFLALDDNN